MFSNARNSKRVSTSSASSSSLDNNHPTKKLPRIDCQSQQNKNNSSQLQNGRSFQQVQSLQNVHATNPALQHSSVQNSILQNSTLQQSSSLQHTSLQQQNNLLQPSPLTCAKANQWNLGARQFEKKLQPQLQCVQKCGWTT